MAILKYWRPAEDEGIFPVARALDDGDSWGSSLCGAVSIAMAGATLAGAISTRAAAQVARDPDPAFGSVATLAPDEDYWQNRVPPVTSTQFQLLPYQFDKEEIPSLPRVAFPLTVETNGRYLVDAAGVPSRIHGDSAWELPTEATLSDVRQYLDSRVALGFNAVLIQITNPVKYQGNSTSPWALQLGGVGTTSALPFLKNISGGTWDGDPTFAHFDADFSQPNDAYHSWIGQIVDEAAARGILVVATPLYIGFNLGAGDGWWQTLVNAGNTVAVATNYGKYLAIGNGGSFAGFNAKTNLIWEHGVDSTPSVESGTGTQGTLRLKAVLDGLVANGAPNLHAGHWKHDFLSTDDSVFAASMQLEAVYTHGPNVYGPTYARSRLAYSHSPTLPAYLTETTYEGDLTYGNTRANDRYSYWGAVLSGIGGALFGSNHIWTFTTAAAWAGSTTYSVGQFRSNGGIVYKVASITTGITASSGGPSGTGTGITDGGVTWNFEQFDWKQGLYSNGALDFRVLGQLLNSVAWNRLVPSGLSGMRTLVTAGTGTFTTMPGLGDFETGGKDWVVAAATASGELLLAYVPTDHTGTLTIDMTAMGGITRSRWFDPTAGTFTADATGLAPTGTHVFTTPGTNAGGATDWLLFLDSSIGVDEDYWTNEVQPVQGSFGRLYLPDADDVPAGFLHGQPDEDYWQNEVPPVQAAFGKLYLPDPEELVVTVVTPALDDGGWATPLPAGAPAPALRLWDGDDLPAGSLFGQADEDFWISGVAPTGLQFARLYLPDAEELVVTAPPPFSLDDALWTAPLPAVFVQRVPAPWDGDDVPAGSLFGRPDEDFWTSGLQPTPYVFGKLYLPDPEEIAVTPPPVFSLDDTSWAPAAQPLFVQRVLQPWDGDDVPAGSLFGQPDEDFWVNQVLPVQFVQTQRLPLADLDEVLPPQPTIGVDEDFDARLIVRPAAPLLFTPLYAYDGQETVPFVAPPTVDEDFWSNPVAPTSWAFARLLLPDADDVPAGSLVPPLPRTAILCIQDAMPALVLAKQDATPSTIFTIEDIDP